MCEYFKIDKKSSWASNAEKFNFTIKWHFNIFTKKTVILKCNNISQYHCIFDQIKAAFESIKYFLQKKCSDPKHLNNDSVYLG